MTQILLGSMVLGLCAFLHVGLIALSVPFLVKLSAFTDAKAPRFKVAILIGLGFAWIVFAHTVQVWVWAAVLLGVDVFKSLETAIYFSVVTYTTLGYGDVTLTEGFRIFASFGAITGLLTFGVSTAFLVALVGRILPRTFGQDRTSDT